MNSTGRHTDGDSARFFDGARLTLARQLAGLRKNALADRVGKTPTAIAGYENGNKRPSSKTVAELALALGVDVNFFLPSRGQVGRSTSIAHFRSLRNTTQIERDQAHAYGLLCVDVLAALERHVEFPAIDIPRIAVTTPSDFFDDDPELAARKVREAWGLSLEPVPHLVRLLENRGILVVFTPAQNSSVDAYSMETAVRPVVLMNPLKCDYFRQRFDVAHELGHLVMHVDAEPGGRTVEDQAHRFASEFLLPTDAVLADLPRNLSWKKLFQLKEHWGVSLQALLFKARRLDVFSENTYRNAMASISAQGWKRREPGPMPAVEQPSLLPRAIEILHQTGINQASLIAECRAPNVMFDTITARSPRPSDPVPSNTKGTTFGVRLVSSS